MGQQPDKNNKLQNAGKSAFPYELTPEIASSFLVPSNS